MGGDGTDDFAHVLSKVHRATWYGLFFSGRAFCNAQVAIL